MTTVNIQSYSSDIQKQIAAGTPNVGDEFILSSGERIKKTSAGYETATPEITPTSDVPVRTPRDIYEEKVGAFLTASETTATSNRDKQRQLQQQSLDRELARIDTETAARVAEQQRIGAGELAKTRGINIRAGLAGSPFAEALRGEVTTATGKAVGVEQARGQELRERTRGTFEQNLQQIEERYNERISQVEQGRLKIFGERVVYSEAQQKEALGDFYKMAESGKIDFEKLKNDGLLEGYSQQTGKSVEYLEQEFNWRLPEDQQSNYRWQDGKAFQWDPKTKDFIRRSDLDSKEGGTFKLEKFGDYILKLPIDENGNIDIDPNKSMSDYIWGEQPAKPTDKVDIRQRKSDLADLLAQVATYTDREQAIIELDKYRASIVTRVGEGGLTEIQTEIDRRFPLPEETPKEEVKKTGGLFGAVKSFFGRLFQKEFTIGK